VFQANVATNETRPLRVTAQACFDVNIFAVPLDIEPPSLHDEQLS